MISKTENEIKNLRTGGKLLARVLRELSAMVEPGITTASLDIAAEKIIREGGGVPAFLNYLPEGGAYPFPATLCISLNDEVVHGIPSTERVLKNGDMISLDLGLSYNGYFVDSARTLCVGEGDATAQKLIEATKEATMAGIKAARVGNRVGDIGAAIEEVAKKYHFEVVEDLGGHAVGKEVHETPYIPNEGVPGTGPKLQEGLVIAIEPMLAEGKGAITLMEDEWTYRMRDKKRCAHVEHTIIITKKGPEILTA
ncbi:MAG TPA: type I methionyl aminopeptidase [Candidatus Paceibacterota bacterium]|nr:type I methionyl aminopeptidase [Candidatus Paceibacterota bacterium]